MKFFITVLGAKFNIVQKKVKLSRAGHLPLYYYSSTTNSVHALTPNGIGIGLSDDHIFDKNLEELELQYTRNDIFLFCTDGFIDAINQSREFFG